MSYSRSACLIAEWDVQVRRHIAEMLHPAGRLQMSHGPKLQHHFYSTKGMCPTTEVTEADTLQLELQRLRLALPGFKFRQICQAYCTNENPEKSGLDFLEAFKICLERGYGVQTRFGMFESFVC